IGVVERNGIDAVEARKIVFVGRVFAVPRHHVKRRVIDLRLPQPAHELGDPAEIALAIFKRGSGSQKVARICQAVRADGPQLRQPEGLTVVLANIAARLRLNFRIWKNYPELHPARNYADLARRNFENAKL